jgi:hypothetical protein
VKPTKGVPEIVDCAVEDHETWNPKVKARTRDTFIQVRVARVANLTSCLDYHMWRPTLGCCVGYGVVCSPPTYPALLYIV